MTEENVKCINSLPIVTGKCIRTYSTNTGRYMYKPVDKSYFTMKYHENKKNIECEICGKVVVGKILQHQRSNRCRLLKYILLEDEQKLKDKIPL